MSETLYLIDGHAQIFRAYFAIRGGMASPVTGEPSHAVFGFAGMLLKLFSTFHPTYVAMAVDTAGKTFRDEMYDQYKANRPPMPADLHSQEQRIYDMTRMFGVPIFPLPGAEADDVIATLVHRILHNPKYTQVNIRIVSKDKDLEQLLSDRVTMFIHTDTTIDPRKLMEEKGVTPAQVVDMLTLMGDKVDNVPGVAGVGPKTASELIKLYGSVDGIYAHIDKIKGKRREELEKAKDQLPLSRKLVTLKSDLDFAFDLEQARVGPINAEGLRRLFADMGFRRHQTDLDRLINEVTGGEPAAATPQAITTTVSTAPSPRMLSTAEKPMEFAAGLFDTGDSPESGGAATAVGELPTLEGKDYRSITTLEQLRALVKSLRKVPMLALDTETVGLGHRAKLCGLSLAWEETKAVYIPVLCPQPPGALETKVVLDALAPIFTNPDIPKCGHNLKYDLLVLRHAGADVRGVAFDSMIASHLLSMPGHGLDHLALALLNHRMMQITQLIGTATMGRGDKGQKQKTMDQVDLDLITKYAADDAEVSLRLQKKLEQELRILGMEELATKVEMPLVEVLADMEHAGIRVDPAVLEVQKGALATRIVELRDKIHEAVGEPFNIDSPKQLAEVLFKKMGLPVIKKTKTGPSTDIEVLEALAEHESLTAKQATVPMLVVEYRQLSKLVSTYLDALRESIDADTGRVHAQFHQTGAATGRLSSSDPNLQNIPIRTDVGRQIRKAFVAEPGNLLISADYSQIELRVLAHLSGDKGLIDAFENDLDIHTAVAAQVFNVDQDKVTSAQRGYAKVINFGIIYGVTAYGLARRIEGLDVEKAAQLIADYRRRFSGIDEFLELCIRKATDLGYVTTMMGRRRAIPQIKAYQPNVRNLGERLAINSVVQGSAADLIKLAMVNLHRRIQRENLPMKLLLQIHDELVLETPSADAERMAKIVQDEMESAMKLRVPLKVDAGVGPDWLACK